MFTASKDTVVLQFVSSEIVIPVVRLYVKADAITFPENHAGCPDLDLDGHDLTGFELLLFIVFVVRPVRSRQLRVELSM